MFQKNNNNNQWDEEKPGQFIGGAERARRRAQNFLKKHHIRNDKGSDHHQHHHQKKQKLCNNDKHSKYLLPKRMKSSERFYASLLQHDVHSIQQSSNSDVSWKEFMEITCEYTLGIPIPSALPKTFKDRNEYYTLLSTLVIEESRCILVDALKQRSCNNSMRGFDTHDKWNGFHNRRNDNGGGGGGHILNLIDAQKNDKSGFVSMTFAKHASSNLSSMSNNRSFQNRDHDVSSMGFTSFTSKELFDMKPGCIFEVTMIENNANNARYDRNQFQNYPPYENNVRYNRDQFRNHPPPYENNARYNRNQFQNYPPFENNIRYGRNQFQNYPHHENNARYDRNQFQNYPPFERDDGHPPRRKISFLASVIPKADKGIDGDGVTTLPLMMFCRNETLTDALLGCSPSKTWHLLPITSLISEQRQFDACMKAPNVSFMNKLLGMKTATHTRFDDSDSSSSSSSDDEKDEYSDGNENSTLFHPGEYIDDEDDVELSNIDEKEEPNSDDDSSESLRKEIIKIPLRIPKLNKTQEKAANSFLNSSTSSVSLVQGPPGTGKTTFMTSVLCQTLFNLYDENNRVVNNWKRIMVTAPTNKAIIVLASRFLQALNGCDDLNVVLIGVEDKLISDDIENSELNGIFVYTWVEGIIKRYLAIDNILKNCRKRGLPDQDVKFIMNEAMSLKDKLKLSIPSVGSKSGVLGMAQNVLSYTEEISENGISTDMFLNYQSSQLKCVLSELVSTLKDLSNKDVVDELLATANIIFCTLSSSGVSALKRTCKIDGK